MLAPEPADYLDQRVLWHTRMSLIARRFFQGRLGRRSLWLPVLLMTLTLPVLSVAGEADDAADWFARMRQAVHGTDYEGRFVYQVGEQLDGMYVVHRVRDGHELERLVALDGEPKQVIRGQQGVACLEPRSRHISVVGNRAGIQDRNAPDLAHLRKFYEFVLLGPVRAAGRQARRLEIRPRDRLRFGYRIDLDEATALPLRSVMLERDGRVRSQTLFVDLKTGRHVTPIEMDVSALELTRMPPRGGEGGEAAEAAPLVDWQFRGLPAGFRLITQGSVGEGARHYVFTDGLASVSLYIEPGHDREPVLNGFSRIGATEAFGMVRDGYQLVAVGEVPRDTLRQIVHTAEPR